MQKKQVAVIDVGSSKITAIIGERGINKTFIIKGRYSFDYDGFANGEFFNLKQLKQVLNSVADCIIKGSLEKIETVYVGVPGDFTRVYIRDSQLSFPKKRKIVEEDVDALFDSAFVMTSAKYTLINRSAIVYELDDFRRLANPVGSISEILSGKLSFIMCSNYFIEAVKNCLVDCGLKNVECVSSALAQAMYLIEAEMRDRIALVADVGYITTTFSVIQGDGIIYQHSFDFGGGYITAGLVEKFDIDFNIAENLKRKANICALPSGKGIDVIEADNNEFYPLNEVVAVVKENLDLLCENVANALDKSGFSIPDYVPLYITGGGISYIRGAKEHVSARLGMPVDVLSPRIPLMEKPTESTLLSLLDLALEQI